MDRALTRYHEALAYLFARTTGASKLGLERTRALLRVLGDPHDRLAALHVAGTNGKGSVCAALEALLRARGLRVGRYTSPHLVDFRERIVVDGAPIAAADVVAFIERWTPDVERIGATFFEATTALALAHFAAAEVDAVVLETGLGGRLDATNVVTPLVAGVTTIGIDHTEYLGATLEEIAREKAGIFKPGRPAVVGEADARIGALLLELGRALGASPVVHADEVRRPSAVRVTPEGTYFTLGDGGDAVALYTPLVGTHQARNAAVALAMLDCAGARFALDASAIAEALRTLSLPGRFQRMGAYVFDVAHNGDGARVLAGTLRAVRPAQPVVALLAVLRDKDWRAMMQALAPAVDHFVLTIAPTSPPGRTWDPAQAAAFAREHGWSAEVVVDFESALAKVAPRNGTTLVTGSFHTVGDAMSRLHLSPLPE